MSEKDEFERPFIEDIEVFFSEFIEYFGGKVVEKLIENNTDKPNADYLFENPKIVAELKTFEKDVFSNPEDFSRLEVFYDKWLESGMISEDDFKNYAFRGGALPANCIKDLVNSASKTVERAIHKANKQIKETKSNFNMPKADGVIFLINNGNYFFSNKGFIGIISQLIGRKFKEASFDVIVYLTVNQVTRKDSSDLDYSLWVPIYSKIDKNGETLASDELFGFIDELGHSLYNDFFVSKIGEENKDFIELKNIKELTEELNKHKFLPKDRAFKKK